MVGNWPPGILSQKNEPRAKHPIVEFNAVCRRIWNNIGLSCDKLIYDQSVSCNLTVKAKVFI